MCFFGLLIRSSTWLFGNDDAGKQEPLCSLHVTPSAIISTSFGGDSRIWGRPTGSCILHAFSHCFLHSLHRLYSCVFLSVCLWVCGFGCGCSHNAGWDAYSCPLGSLLSNNDTLLPLQQGKPTCLLTRIRSFTMSRIKEKEEDSIVQESLRANEHPARATDPGCSSISAANLFPPAAGYTNSSIVRCLKPVNQVTQWNGPASREVIQRSHLRL